MLFATSSFSGLKMTEGRRSLPLLKREQKSGSRGSSALQRRKKAASNHCFPCIESKHSWRLFFICRTEARH